MDWNEKLQTIIDYIEEHLQRKEEPIQPQEIEKIAGCSYTFFQKVFSYINGISFAEYIRNRKLTLAGYDIKSSRIKVIDLSYKYGYDSPTSFTKAFQQFHGVSPTIARNQQIELRIYPKMQVNMQPQYAWRLEHRSAMRLIGKSIKISKKNNAHYLKVPEFWSECQKDGTYAKLISLDDANPQGIFGLFYNYNDENQEVEYAMMVNSHQELEEGFTEIIIPEVTWAIFDCHGPVPQAIHNGWQYLYQEWLVQYPFQHADCPDLEWYSSGNAYSQDYLSQILIAIIEER